MLWKKYVSELAARHLLPSNICRVNSYFCQIPLWHARTYVKICPNKFMYGLARFILQNWHLQEHVQQHSWRYEMVECMPIRNFLSRNILWLQHTINTSETVANTSHAHVLVWFPNCWPFVFRIHRWPKESPPERCKAHLKPGKGFHVNLTSANIWVAGHFQHLEAKLNGAR